MTSNAERIQKLATKLATVEANKTKYDTMYNEITSEITTILAGEAVNAVTTAMAKPKMKSGELSEKVLAYLNKAGGQTLQEIVTKIKVEGKKVGLALFHLGRKGQVFQREGRYFAAPNQGIGDLAMAAKSAPDMTGTDED